MPIAGLPDNRAAGERSSARGLVQATSVLAAALHRSVMAWRRWIG